MKYSQTPCALKNILSTGSCPNKDKEKIKKLHKKEQKKKVLKKHLCNSSLCEMKKGLRIKKTSVLLQILRRWEIKYRKRREDKIKLTT